MVSRSSGSSGPSFTSSGTLFEVERRFGEGHSDDPVWRTTEGVALLASAGELAESRPSARGGAAAERRHTPGRDRDRVAGPPVRRPLYRRVLTRFTIPVAVQADMAAARTKHRRGD